MRIAHAHRALVAVLHFAIFFITISCHVHHRDSSHTSEHVRHSSRNLTWSQELPLRDKQLYILQESYKQDGGEYEGSGVECCPSVLEMTEPKSGTSLEGVLVELYRSNNNTQRFYERSCAPNVEGQPCRFIDKKLYNQSKCVQQWSHSYALLEDPHPHHHQHHHEQQLSITGTVHGHTQWTLGYIKVRSGCRCKLFPKKERKKKRFQHNNGLT